MRLSARDLPKAELVVEDDGVGFAPQAQSGTRVGTRIVNAKARPGVVKFAGFYEEAVLHTAAVTRVVKPKKPLELATRLDTRDVVGSGKRTRAAKWPVTSQTV